MTNLLLITNTLQGDSSSLEHLGEHVFKGLSHLLKVTVRGKAFYMFFHLAGRETKAHSISGRQTKASLRAKQVNDSRHGTRVHQGGHGRPCCNHEPLLNNIQIICLSVDHIKVKISIVRNVVLHLYNIWTKVIASTLMRHGEIIDASCTGRRPLLRMGPFHGSLTGRCKARMSGKDRGKVFRKRFAGPKDLSLDDASHLNAQIGPLFTHDSTANAFQGHLRFVATAGRSKGDDASALSTSHHGDLDHFLQHVQSRLTLIGEPQMV